MSWIAKPNPVMAHCYNCEHLEFTEQWQVCYPWEVGLGHASHSQGAFLKWPGNAACSIHPDITANALNCMDFEHKSGFNHWSLHQKYRH
jgi:hypothetical protein